MWLAIVVVLLILYILSYAVPYLARKVDVKRKKKKLMKEGAPARIYNASVGDEYDEAAATALHKALFKEKMSGQKAAPDNSLLIADILRFNVIPHLRGAAREGAVDMARGFYDKTLDRLLTAAPGDDGKPVEFMLQRIGNFYNDLYLPRHPEAAPAVTTVLPQVARTVITKEAEAKKAAAPNRAAFQTEYFENRKVTSDPQNVHDSEVNSELGSIYDRLVRKNNDEGGELSGHDLRELATFISNYNFGDAQKREEAQRIYGLMSKEHPVTQMKSKNPATEGDVLEQVWKRVHSRENLANRAGLQESLMDALVNSYDTNANGERREVCTGGRCARVLGSLTLLDEDKRIAQPVKTEDILRSEIFSRTHHLVRDALDKVEPTLANDYLTGRDTEQTHGLEERLKQEVESRLREEYKQTDQRVLSGIIDEAKAGI